MLTKKNYQQCAVVLIAFLVSCLITHCAAAAPSGPSQSVSDSLLVLERSINKPSVSMDELDAQLGALLQDATTDAERSDIHKGWGDAYRLRGRYAEAVASYERCQELVPEAADPMLSAVPYYKDICKVEFIYGSMRALCLAALIIAIICGCLFLRVQAPSRRALVGIACLCVGWIVLGYGVMVVGDAAKVAAYPIGNLETGGNYVFVLLGAATNPYFWKFVCWSTPVLLLLGGLAANVRANRYAHYTVLPSLIIQAVALAALLAIGLFWFPSRYAQERIPYFDCLVLAKGHLLWIRPMVLGGAAALVIACAVATVFALKKKRIWLHRPCQLMCALTAVLSLVGLFHHVNRSQMVHITPEACYYNGPEIEEYVRMHPGSFVNLDAEEAESEELKKFILQKTPRVPRERFQEERRDDAK